MLLASSEEEAVRDQEGKSPSPEESSVDGTPGQPDYREMALFEQDMSNVNRDQMKGQIKRHHAQDLSNFQL